MPPKITRDDVLQVAALAQLDLTDAEVDLFAAQLSRILDYAGLVQQVDTAGVTPSAEGLTPAPVWREDEPRPPLDREIDLAQAPDAATAAGLFRVPKVL